MKMAKSTRLPRNHPRTYPTEHHYSHRTNACSERIWLRHLKQPRHGENWVARNCGEGGDGGDICMMGGRSTARSRAAVIDRCPSGLFGGLVQLPWEELLALSLTLECLSSRCRFFLRQDSTAASATATQMKMVGPRLPAAGSGETYKDGITSPARRRRPRALKLR